MPDRLTLVYERLPDGSLRVTAPALPGWGCVSRDVVALGRCIDGAWVEQEIAAYAAAHDHAYDAEHHEDRTGRDARPVVRAVEGSDRGSGGRVWRLSHDPAHWTPLPGGWWESPAGRRYRPDASILAHVIARRTAAGLPVVHPDGGEHLAETG